MRCIGPRFGLFVPRALAFLVLVGALPLGAAATETPQPVSPGARSAGVIAELRCPTFSWAGIEGVAGYELAVFRVSRTPTDEPVLVTRASVPGDARGWTPPVGQCLERGERYAWSVAAAVQHGPLEWAPAFLFEVEGAPSTDELEHAIATIRRHLATAGGGDGGEPVAGELNDIVEPQAAKLRELVRAGAGPEKARAAAEALIGDLRRQVEARASRRVAPDAADSPTGASRTASASTSPVLGAGSLTVAGQIHLGAASDVFKEGDLFLWDDEDGHNTSLGRNALSSLSGGAHDNTALGFEALRSTAGDEMHFYGSNNTAVGSAALRGNTNGVGNTATGFEALHTNTAGAFNTAVGFQALYANTTGFLNSASGSAALRSNTTGIFNTASGSSALVSNTTGMSNSAFGLAALASNTVGFGNTAAGFDALAQNTFGTYNAAFGSGALRSSAHADGNAAFGTNALGSTTGGFNTALGYAAGRNNTTGYFSIFIGNYGAATDNATIKIGEQDQQTSAFLAGVRGVTTRRNDAIPVLVDSAGQLGTVSSSRSVKQDIQDLGTFADRLLELRPVAFRYKQHAAESPDTPVQFGLIAEEVAEVFPELVVYDDEGKPQTVKYHLLSSLLLGELQQLHARVEELESRSEPR